MGVITEKGDGVKNQNRAIKKVRGLLARVNTPDQQKKVIKNERPYARAEIRGGGFEFNVGTVGQIGMAFILGSSFESWDKAVEEMEDYLVKTKYIVKDSVTNN